MPHSLLHEMTVLYVIRFSLSLGNRYRDVLRPGTLRGCYQGLLGSDTTFPHLLGSIKRDRQLRTHHIAVAITKPPETVSCSLKVFSSSCIASLAPSCMIWIADLSH